MVYEKSESGYKLTEYFNSPQAREKSIGLTIVKGSRGDPKSWNYLDLGFQFSTHKVCVEKLEVYKTFFSAGNLVTQKVNRANDWGTNLEKFFEGKSDFWLSTDEWKSTTATWEPKSTKQKVNQPMKFALKY